MYTLELFERARVVCEDCAGVTNGEEILLVHDDTVSPAILAGFQMAAKSLGAKVVTMCYQARRVLLPNDFALFAGASLDEEVVMPRALLGAVRESDVMIFLVSEMDLFFFSPAFECATQGKRLIRGHYLDEKAVVRYFPASLEEVSALRRVTEQAGEYFRAASLARITSAEGTDLTLRLGQYRTNISTGIVNQPGGGRQSIPGGQVARVPDDGSANGVVVIDRTIGAPIFQKPDIPVTFIVEQGNVLDIRGGAEAKRLAQWMDALGDPNLRHLTELGMGTNPCCRLEGVNPPGEDTHSAGCVSIALGTDVHIGGRVRATAHMDCTMRFATLTLDGRKIVDEGRLVLE